MTMNKKDYPKNDPLIGLFYGKKTGEKWYKESLDGEKFWIEKEVKSFWSAIRKEKMAKEDFDFSGMIFPDFQTVNETFWSLGSAKRFSKKVSFRRSKFEGRAGFSKIKFEAKTTFEDAKFLEDCWFVAVSFNGVSEFRSTHFAKEVLFLGCRFNDKMRFYRTQFHLPVKFRLVSFGPATSFEQTNFRSGLHFTRNRCGSNSYIDFNDVILSDEHKTVFEISQLDGGINDGWIQFENVIFNNRSKFMNTDFKNTSFVNCDLVPVKFYNCVFKKTNYRTFLRIEKEEYNPYENEIIRINMKPKFIRIPYYELVGETYRQIKKNQKDSQNWAQAGDAYRSEMVMMQKVFWLKFLTKKNPVYLFNWFLLAFNGLTSGFQQSMVRPIVWLAMIYGIFALVYFLNGMVASDALYQSLFNSFPISGRINTDENHLKALMLLQRILSTILLAFFGLAVRARLKQ
ncbi:hypothetical protein FGF1_03480 [Flavobacteriaceae bacterium GF1]